MVALYNPVSRHRPWQFGRAVELLAAHRAPGTPVVVGRDVGQPGEAVRLVTLAELPDAPVDMRTVVIVGSSTTRLVTDPPAGRAYTPRTYPAPPPAPPRRPRPAPRRPWRPAGPGGEGRALDHHHRQPQRAGGDQLGGGGGRPAVLGHDRVDAVLGEQRQLVVVGRTGPGPGRLDAQGQGIGRPRPNGPGTRRRSGRTAPARSVRSTGTPGVARGLHGGGGGLQVGHARPAVAVGGPPRRPLDPQARDPDVVGGGDGVPAHVGGEGMGGVDQHVDPLGTQVGGEASPPPKPPTRVALAGATGAVVRPANDVVTATWGRAASERARAEASLVPPSSSTRTSSPATAGRYGPPPPSGMLCGSPRGKTHGLGVGGQTPSKMAARRRSSQLAQERQRLDQPGQARGAAG